MRENDFLQWIAENVTPHPRVEVGIGDDMAIVQLSGNALLKIDQCLDQVHFDLRRHSARQAGTKAVNRCLSDCAAMAVLPTAIMIAVALPRDGPGSGEAFAQQLFLACRDAALRFNCPLVGGDTAIWGGGGGGCLAITVAALGETPPDHAPIRRSGVKPGDTLFVSGALGGSILGRHLTFEPRIDLARRLASLGPALHAMMDLSDGLAQDLPRLCRASNVGAKILAAQLPIHMDAHTLSEQDHLPAGLHALADGEDYELLFALDPEATPEAVSIAQAAAIPLTAIGTANESSGLTLIDPAGNAHPWPRAGFEHHS